MASVYVHFPWCLAKCPYCDFVSYPVAVAEPLPRDSDRDVAYADAVLRELDQRAPEGLRYLVLRLADGGFVHVVEQADGAPALTSLESFKAFGARVRDRATTPPAAVDAEIVGNYRMLAT